MPPSPRRGEKDFEPHGTSHQDGLLASSRAAMHAALDNTRVHLPKTHLVGHWHAESQQCAIPHPTGAHFKTLGRVRRDGSLWLLPEETLYLLERGALDVRWGGGEPEREVPMSLQGAYAACIGAEVDGRISLERWSVYAGLKRSGFIVTRAPTWLDADDSSSTEALTLIEHPPRSQLSLFRRLYASLIASSDAQPSTSGPSGRTRSLQRLLGCLPPSLHRSLARPNTPYLARKHSPLNLSDTVPRGF